jgi:hypothetical protein
VRINHYRSLTRRHAKGFYQRESSFMRQLLEQRDGDTCQSTE